MKNYLLYSFFSYRIFLQNLHSNIKKKKQKKKKKKVDNNVRETCLSDNACFQVPSLIASILSLISFKIHL